MKDALVIICIVQGFLLLLNYRRTRAQVLSIFGGSVDKMELAGVIFTVLFAFMIIKEGNRTHEWHHYNELYIFFTAGAAMTGLGLSQVLNTMKEIRLGSTTTKTEVMVKETSTNTKPPEEVV